MVKSRLRSEKCAAFPRAALYRQFPAGQSILVRDGAGSKYGFAYSERHLQCVWFDEFFRPQVLHTSDGEEVAVESPGRWNLEPGPDFLDAVLLIGRERRRVVGDVEIHVHPSDWRQHDHANDSRYSRVIAHVVFFHGPSQKALLPPNTVEISLRDDLNADRLFSFESIDTTAYPYAERCSPTPCGAVLAERSVECAVSLLESAGEARLELKAERMRQAIEQFGEEQVLYEEVLCALGYKNNRVPFRCLARHVTVEDLRRESGGDITNGFVLLLGVSGLLPTRLLTRWDAETRGYVRRQWDFWWKRQPLWESLVMPREAWSLAGVRPQNHPVRRMVAAASFFCGKETILDRLRVAETGPAEQWVARMMTVLLKCQPLVYWGNRLGLGAPQLDKEVALVGVDRASAILSNVIVPFMAAAGRLPCPPGGIPNLLPAASNDGVVKRTASALFGRDHNPKLHRTGLRQHGLLQIHHDFCESDRSACKACALPSAIAAFRE